MSERTFSNITDNSKNKAHFVRDLQRKLNCSDESSKIKAVRRVRELFKRAKGRYDLQPECFDAIASALGSSNDELLSVAISVVAYACLSNKFRDLFMQSPQGVDHLLRILESKRGDEITCRAWRLTGNLLRSPAAAQAVMTKGVADLFATQLDNLGEMSKDTKLCFATAFKYGVNYGLATRENFAKLTDLLTLESEQAEQTRFALTLIDYLRASRLRHVVSDENIQALIKIAAHPLDDVKKTVIQILIAIFLSRKTRALPEYYTIALGYIELMSRRLIVVNEGSVKTMAYFTTLSNVRNALKHSELLPELIQMGISQKIPDLFILLSNYIYDIDVIKACALNGELVKLVIEKIPSDEKRLSALLMALARAPSVHPVLVSQESLETLTSKATYRSCLQDLIGLEKNAVPVLTSGLCWKISECGCNLENIGGANQPALVERVANDSEEFRRRVYLAVPFLVNSWKKVTSRANLLESLNVIRNAFDANLTDVETLAAVCRLATLFSGTEKQLEINIISPTHVPIKSREQEEVTFVLDDGGHVSWPRDLAAQISPVFSAMLCGQFVESRQDCVRFPDCSSAAMMALRSYFLSDCDMTREPVEVLLELLMLADRLFLPALSNHIYVTTAGKLNQLPTDSKICLTVLVWAHEFGALLQSDPRLQVLEDMSHRRIFGHWAHLKYALLNSDSRDIIREKTNELLEICKQKLAAKPEVVLTHSSTSYWYPNEISNDHNEIKTDDAKKSK